ncbi:hypothetical protein OROGR_020182 [Orobanche gracilis]
MAKLGTFSIFFLVLTIMLSGLYATEARMLSTKLGCQWGGKNSPPSNKVKISSSEPSLGSRLEMDTKLLERTLHYVIGKSGPSPGDGHKSAKVKPIGVY